MHLTDTYALFIIVTLVMFSRFDPTMLQAFVMRAFHTNYVASRKVKV